jgi:hypothetical protein
MPDCSTLPLLLLLRLEQELGTMALPMKRVKKTDEEEAKA